MKKIPFEVVRNDRKGLVAQVVDGFRTAIANGYYKEGDVLPSRKEIAGVLGVSVRVPRDAMERLACEGLVNPRRRLGSTVLATGNVLWRGRVLFVWLVEDETSYFATKLINEVRRKISKEGYLFSSVALPGTPSGKVVDMSPLDMAFCQSADLVIALAVPPVVQRHLSEKGVRFICIGRAGRFPGCVGYVCVDSFRAFERFAECCERQGVSRVLEVSCGERLLRENLMKSRGISVEHCNVWPRGRGHLLEGIMRSAFDLFLRRFTVRQNLPEAIFCSDDYIAFGAITALAILGIKAPEDVRLAVLANKGFAPVYDRSLTMIEYDYAEYGVGIAEYALGVLAGRKVPRRICFSPQYIAGETFPDSPGQN